MSAGNTLRNPYPAFNLPIMYDYLRKLSTILPRAKRVDRKTLIHGLGLEETGKASNVIGSLIHYGLLIREDKEYYLSELALNLLGYETENPTAWRQLALKAATAPQLFNSLYAHYLEEVPESDSKKMLASKYNITDIDESKARKIIRDYRTSLAFAKGNSFASPPAVVSSVEPGSEKLRPDRDLEYLTDPSVLIRFSDGTELRLPQSVISEALRRYTSELTAIKSKLGS